jgi:hypothetical protein
VAAIVDPTFMAFQIFPIAALEHPMHAAELLGDELRHLTKPKSSYINNRNVRLGYETVCYRCAKKCSCETADSAAAAPAQLSEAKGPSKSISSTISTSMSSGGRSMSEESYSSTFSGSVV